MDDFSEDELSKLKSSISDELWSATIKFRDLEVADCENEGIEATVVLLSDNLQPELASHFPNRKSRLLVRGPMESSDKLGQQVYWGQATFSVAKDHSHFIPVPEEYGNNISISFGWEFDAESLEPSYADVRERNSIHFVSVLPSFEMQKFVRCVADAMKRYT